MSVDWIVINERGKDIGAVGFVDGKALVVASFFDDLDGDRSGSVGMGEWAVGKLSPISLQGKAVTEVAMAAKYNMDVLKRDAGFIQMANNIFANFARGLVLDGIYAVYFSRGVKMSAGGIAKMVTSGTVKQLAVRKGFETTVKKAFNAATDR